MEKLYDIVIDKEEGQYLYVQLYNKIKKMIQTGELKAHYKLPPIRKFAEKLEVNNVTVVNAYKLLEKDDFVYKRVGSGTFVSDINSFLDHESKDGSIVSANEKKIFEGKINFASSTPTSDLFPIDEFKEALNDVLDRDKGYAFEYQKSQGYLPLRDALANYMNNLGVDIEKEDIQIVSGAQQGIDILSKTLIDYGDIVITESPTYAGAIASFESRAARIISIPMKSDGMDMTSLENKLSNFRPKFIYVMPNYHNPTGYSYSLEKKKKLLELAKKYDTLIIEDDYLSELHFRGEDTCTLKSLDTENKVIYLKSFSKLFMPGLRLGFAVIPKSIFKDVLTAKHTSDISTSGLMQRAFELYLNRGCWKKQIKSIEKIYLNRYDLMVKSIKNNMPSEVEHISPKGGLNFWFALPDGFSSVELYEYCVDRGILIMPGVNFYPGKTDSKYFRLSISSVKENEIEDGIKKLSKLLKEFIGRGIKRRESYDYASLL